MESKPIKIIGFTQLRNELSKGNLVNWLRQMFEICQYVYIYDQDSDDGSKEVYKNHPNLVVIESINNDFKQEIKCKKILLERLLNDHPDTEFILWLDGDSLLESAFTENNNELLYSLCQKAKNENIDAFILKHYNLWRSDIHYRLDNQYNSLNDSGVVSIWRNNGMLKFENTNGLHQRQYPNGISKTLKLPFGIIHRGFATDYQIITKYNVYKENGQNGWALDRLLDESTLQVTTIDKSMLPTWFTITDEVNPINKVKIRDVYNKIYG